MELRLPAALRLAAGRGGFATAARSGFAGRSSHFAAARSGFAAARLAAALQVVSQAVFPATLRLATRNRLATRRCSDFAAAATQRESLGVASEHEHTSHQGGSHQNPTLHGRAPKINIQMEGHVLVGHARRRSRLAFQVASATSNEIRARPASVSRWHFLTTYRRPHSPSLARRQCLSYFPILPKSFLRILRTRSALPNAPFVTITRGRSIMPWH